MQLSRQVTGALAWAGLVVVVAVPAAELISSKLRGADAPEVAPVIAVSEQPAIAIEAPSVVVAADAPEAAPVAPAKAMAAPKAEPVVQVADAPTSAPAAPVASGNAVDDYLAANKTLPSYITPSGGEAAGEPTPPATPAAAQLASTLSSADAPVAAPSGSTAAIPAPPAVAEPASDVATASVAVPAPVPLPASSRPKVRPDETVTEADLKDWKSGTLVDYLKTHNLLSGDGNTGN